MCDGIFFDETPHVLDSYATQYRSYNRLAHSWFDTASVSMWTAGFPFDACLEVLGGGGFRSALVLECLGGSEGGGGAYSLVDYLSRLSIDHASLSRRSTVSTSSRDTSNIWALSRYVSLILRDLFLPAYVISALLGPTNLLG